MSAATDADLGYIESLGLEQLRTAVSDYLGRARGVAVDPSRTIITTGCTHALGLISHVLARRGASRIAVENPSNVVVRTAIERGGLNPVAVPVDGSGFCTDLLSEAGVDAVLVSPAHQFPTGAALTADRRSALITWARNSGSLVIEDDYDAEFRYDRAPIGALQGLSPDAVAYIGSTAKTLAPGIRLGWAVMPPNLYEIVADELNNSMRHVSGIDQLALADFITRGEFDRHLRQMRAIYKRRRDLLVSGLATHVPDLRVTGIAAGLHVVLQLPSRDAEVATYTQALENGIMIHPLSRHTMPGYDGPAGVLIGYGAISDAAIPYVVEQLAAAIRGADRGNGTQARRILGSKKP
jgi:GntR family transcriptional regulator / MocR family aminotransferase